MSFLPRRPDVVDVDLVARCASLEAEISANRRLIASLNAQVSAARAQAARLDRDRLALIREAEARDRIRNPFAATPPEPAEADQVIPS